MRIGYARVSSRQQADTEALDQQIKRLEKAGAQKILYDIESGRKDTRKSFNQTIALAKNGVATEVIVTRLDRLGRNVISIHKTIETLQKAGVELTILDSPLGDTNSAFGWLTINNIAGLAEFESRLLSERISHGTDYYSQQLWSFTQRLTLKAAGSNSSVRGSSTYSNDSIVLSNSCDGTDFVQHVNSVEQTMTTVSGTGDGQWFGDMTGSLNRLSIGKWIINGSENYGKCDVAFAGYLPYTTKANIVNLQNELKTYYGIL